MPHRASHDRPFRLRTLALVAGAIAVSLAAVRQAPVTQQPPAAPPAAPSTMATPTDSTPQDSSATADSVAMAMPDTAHLQHQMMTAAAPTPPAAPAAWPVDPVTGQTLINGIPVVGKVFIMEKTDGTKKIENVAQALEGEPPVAEAAIVGSAKAPALTQTRRMRGVMIQATLWMNDHKASAVRHRMYAPSTPANSLAPHN
jgi:hypothetical protein